MAERKTLPPLAPPRRSPRTPLRADLANQGQRALSNRLLPVLARDFRGFEARRFALAMRLLGEHGRLGIGRAISASRLALGDILLASLAVWLAGQAATIFPQSQGLRIMAAVLALLALAALFVSLLFLLGAALPGKRPTGIPEELPAAVFFESGRPTPGSPAFPLDATAFREGFRRSTRREMLDGVLVELYQRSAGRQVQEARFRIALLSLGLALLPLGLLALVYLIGLV